MATPPGSLNSFPQRLHNALRALSGRAAAPPPALLRGLEARAAELTRPPTVAVLGEVNSGKSTLVNLLLGHDLLQTSVLPSALGPLRLRYGEKVRLAHPDPGHRHA